MPRLLIATNNPGKATEYCALLEGCGWQVVTPRRLGMQLSTVETGDTYEENAKIKAVAGAQASGLVTLGDDSGLEIEALAGALGVASARFMGEETGYPERFQEIERRLQGLPEEKRRARFVCVIAIASPGSTDVRFVRGEVEGIIIEEPRGEGGFGYDPIFRVSQHSATMAEISPQEKNLISHRGRAAALAAQVLRELIHE